ncbi:uncharacterized protein LOC103573187 [Microplitis demolitor]|uniref:uncharacterized protein LOC103573187 n=1 Tax=Microplitis demolitor TaxID=69319 RepID=UPI0004CCD2E2|nr:uncharacterized protein LOC103573187 [Microplitis demolitor]
MESNQQPAKITNSSLDECICVTDHESQITFLINPNQSGSFFPRSLLPKRLGPSFKTISMTLNLGFERTFLWEFSVADVNQATLGTDFIAHYGLVVSLKYLKLEDPTVNSSSKQQVEESNKQPSQQTTSEVDDNPIHIIDQTSNLDFLVDTGAQDSVIPRSQLPNRELIRDPNYTLRTLNNTEISTYGIHEMAVNFGPNLEFKWNFRVADVPKAILGIDFLRHFKLLVDPIDNTIRHRDSEGPYKQKIKLFWKIFYQCHIIALAFYIFSFILFAFQLYYFCEYKLLHCSSSHE